MLVKAEVRVRAWRTESASVEDGEGELGMHTTRVIYFLERFGQSEHSRSPQRVAPLRLCRFGEAGPRRA
jgi:hypothetical protein